jgi:hypothetical protein
MECPHCGQETDPTLAYCKVCGQQVEFDADALHQAFERDAEHDAVEMLDEQSRAAIYVTVFVLVSVFALRLVLLHPPSADITAGYFPPARLLVEKNLDPAATLDVEPATIDIPEEVLRQEYLAKLKGS